MVVNFFATGFAFLKVFVDYNKVEYIRYTMVMLLDYYLVYQFMNHLFCSLSLVVCSSNREGSISSAVWRVKGGYELDFGSRERL